MISLVAVMAIGELYLYTGSESGDSTDVRVANGWMSGASGVAAES